MKIIREILSWIIPIVIGIIVALLIHRYLFMFAKTDGPSMEPNLQDGERVVVLRQSKIKHLSVIVFDAHGLDPDAKPKSDYVKRVIGLPGDTVTFNRSEGNIYVNNQKVNQNFISNSERMNGSDYFDIDKNWDLKSLSRNWTRNTNSVRVPKGEYFVLGDHRSVSNDGRYWGYVPKSHIKGVVKAFPWSTTKETRNNINNLSY
ncbi:signal peptidase I [Lactobacillus sp. S2-2]|uniref:signal peptidase I n=1 Tax=Lactobacillus sp. S2-2 TaxID=2692917 RepID=UPI001F01C3E4|nr:signal peptidase I [Lactobacillus sp. S2-2]MCF6515404.1 signal peptidase I [Lactobacillus sp. S2-2]